MLAKVTLENFFSFREKTEIILNPKVNVLVGINGSGKSNFLKAIRLLYEGVAGDGFTNTFLGVFGGFDGVSFGLNNNPIKLIFEFQKGNIARSPFNEAYLFEDNVIYEITIFKDSFNYEKPFYLKEKIYLNSGNLDKTDVVLLDIEKNNGFLYERQIGKNEKESFLIRKINSSFGKEVFNDNELFLGQISDPQRYSAMHALVEGIRKISVFNTFDTTEGGNIRDVKFNKEVFELLPDGSNIEYVLEHIWVKHPKQKEIIRKLLNKVNPAFLEFDFEKIANRLLLLLKEKSINKEISIDAISDGTLLYLVLITIINNPHQSIGLTILDEPEKGLHPDMINTIAEIIKIECNKNLLQVIFATHSPLLLNKFDLDEILIFEKDMDNQTRVLYKSEDDFEEWEGNYTAGQLWLNGELGGKRW